MIAYILTYFAFILDIVFGKFTFIFFTNLRKNVCNVKRAACYFVLLVDIFSFFMFLYENFVYMLCLYFFLFPSELKPLNLLLVLWSPDTWQTYFGLFSEIIKICLPNLMRSFVFCSAITKCGCRKVINNICQLKFRTKNLKILTALLVLYSELSWSYNWYILTKIL